MRIRVQPAVRQLALADAPPLSFVLVRMVAGTRRATTINIVATVLLIAAGIIVTLRD